MSKKSNKLPCILTADTNIDIVKPRNYDEKFWSSKFGRYLGHYDLIETNETFERNSKVSSRIDYCWKKDIENHSLKLWDGKAKADNDGHKIFELRTNYEINGIIGKMTIN